MQRNYVIVFYYFSPYRCSKNQFQKATHQDIFKHKGVNYESLTGLLPSVFFPLPLTFFPSTPSDGAMANPSQSKRQTHGGATSASVTQDKCNNVSQRSVLHEA